LASIPFKGQVLNLTSAWWFDQTKNIIPNQVLDVPDPNVTLAKKCDVFPIEFVVRGYITGSTSTSLWTVYNNGDRIYCGNDLPEGLLKNQKLDANMLTPTTKEEHHDRPISPDEIVSEGWMTQVDWDYCSQKALELFAFGQKKAAENGMVLVDTKYEMGRHSDGEIMLIDEIHTPDSSRYWIADTYDERMAANREPQNIDKEFLRLWFVDNCDPYNDKILPEAPEELVIELSSRYIYLYETITGEVFPFPDAGKSVSDRINENLKEVL
jgi:phosphoribosylaminoimidazole-succinocarboxamide synthase